jgi:hypothetical protein
MNFQDIPVEERHYHQLRKDEKIFKKEHGYVWIIGTPRRGGR